MKKLLLWSALFLSAGIQAEIKTLTDVMGREVKVDVPIKRGILTFYYPDYIAVSGMDNFKNIAGISREFWEKFNIGSWNLFLEKMPQLKDIADVGYATNGNFSTEKALSLKPDALIIPKVQYEALSAELPRFEALNVPVIVVDFNDQTLENHLKSIRLFGELAGTTERAEQIAKDYENGMNLIAERIQKANLPKPKIYIEFGNKGPEEYSFTFGKNMWGAIADFVGGDNISKPFIENWGQINPEQFLTNPPEVVLISGTEANVDKNPNIMAMGININEADAQKRLSGFLTRKGWDNIPAVQNKRIFGIYHTASRSITDLASAQFMAKALYPELFADIDPVKTYLDFYQKHLGLEPKGTFFIQLQQ